MRHSPVTRDSIGGSQAAKPLQAAQDITSPPQCTLSLGDSGVGTREKCSRNETGDNLPPLAVLWRESLFFLSAGSEPIVFECAIFSQTQDAKRVEP
jgi:hypothetical protein